MNGQKMFLRDFHSWKYIPPNYTYDATIAEFMLEHPILSDRERDMLHRRYIEKQTLQEIGIDYGLTRERVRQVINAAMEKLKNTQEGEELLGIRKRREYSAFNYPELPVQNDSARFVLPSGHCTTVGLYDEENDTYTLRIVQTLSQHKIGGKETIPKKDLGKVIVSLTFEEPSQMSALSHALQSIANAIDFMKDPTSDKDHKDILMGRYKKKYYPI